MSRGESSGARVIDNAREEARPACRVSCPLSDAGLDRDPVSLATSGFAYRGAGDCPFSGRGSRSGRGRPSRSMGRRPMSTGDSDGARVIDSPREVGRPACRAPCPDGSCLLLRGVACRPRGVALLAGCGTIGCGSAWRSRGPAQKAETTEFMKHCLRPRDSLRSTRMISVLSTARTPTPGLVEVLSGRNPCSSSWSIARYLSSNAATRAATSASTDATAGKSFWPCAFDPVAIDGACNSEGTLGDRKEPGVLPSTAPPSRGEGDIPRKSKREPLLPEDMRPSKRE